MTGVMCWLGFEHKYEELDQVKGHLSSAIGGRYKIERCRRCGQIRRTRLLDVDLGNPLMRISERFWPAFKLDKA